MQAKDFFGLTKEKAMQMDAKNLTIHCTALKVLDDAMLKMLSACSTELQETLQMAVEVCHEFAKSMNVTAGKNATKGDNQRLRVDILAFACRGNFIPTQSLYVAYSDYITDTV